MDRAEVRRRNLIRPEEMPYDMGIPYRDTVPMRYEAADFPAQLEAALEAFDYEGGSSISARHAQRDGGSGSASPRSSRVRATGRSRAVVRIDESGHVTLISGARPHGQGHETVLSQVVADQLGVRPDDVDVRAGDTGLLAFGAARSRAGPP
jgi:carbon-monoxide dehydrogenase large subunit